MSEGRAEGGPEPQDPVVGPPPGPGRQGFEPGAVLLAVERVGAEVTALGRAIASQPEEVAARLDVDAATAAIGVRVGALGSALDQLRLSLLAALDRSANRVDAPAWLPEVRAALAQLAPLAAEHERFREAIAGLAVGERPDRLDAAIAALAAGGPGDRLARVEHAVAELADGVRAGAAVGDALDDLGQRLASIEDAAGRVADDARMLVERVAPVRGGGPADDVEERFEGVVDVLAGVTRRQDQVTAAIASVLDQVRGPKGVDAVVERMEQRERSLAARLDRIDAELRRTRYRGAGTSVEVVAEPDGDTVQAFEVVAAMMEQQERVLTFRLDQIEAELQNLRSATTTAPVDSQGHALEAVLERIDRQQQAVSSHLDWVGERLAEVAAHLVPASGADEAVPGPVAVTAVFDRMEQRERSLVARLDRIEAELRRVTRGAEAGTGPVVVTAGPEVDAESGAAGSLAASVESIATITGDLARLMESTAERLERRLARVESSLGEAPPGVAPPPRPTTPPEAAALRLAELRAERALVQARLQEERLLATQIWDEED